jgi:hypothetical protein
VLSAIHLAAFECLNNIFLALARSSSGPAAAADVGGGRAVWDAVWAALSAVGTQTGLGQERRRAVWEVAAGVLWGVASVCRGNLVCTPLPFTIPFSLSLLVCRNPSPSRCRR